MSLVLAVAILFLLFKYVVLALAIAAVAFAISRMPKRKGPASVLAPRPEMVVIGIGRVLGSCIGGVGIVMACLGTAFLEGIVLGFRAAGGALLIILKVAYRIVAVAFSVLLSILFLSFLFSLFGGRDK